MSAVVLWVTVALTGSGCAVVGFLAQPFDSSDQPVAVDAEYRGMVGQRVAVMVAADQYTLYHHPDAPLRISQAMTQRMAANIDRLTFVAPRDVIEFQHQHPYWPTLRYSELVEALKVDRIVLVDLIDYRLHEPGNAHVWRGVVTANIGVIEADAADPDDFAYYNTVTARFPEDSLVGVLESDAGTIKLGMLSNFTRDAAGLFYDHQVSR